MFCAVVQSDKINHMRRIFYGKDQKVQILQNRDSGRR
nr:MAG TPA: hypothetical protein [Caudoviricetes sp.]